MNADERDSQTSFGRHDRDPLTREVIGAFFEVYNDLGTGFLESVYEKAMIVSLARRGLQAMRQVPLAVDYYGVRVGEFRIDLVVEDRLAAELKAARCLDGAHDAQLLNYLRASHFETGLLLNFGPSPQFRRRVFANDRKRRSDHLRSSAALFRSSAADRTNPGESGYI